MKLKTATPNGTHYRSSQNTAIKLFNIQIEVFCTSLKQFQLKKKSGGGAANKIQILIYIA